MQASNILMIAGSVLAATLATPTATALPMVQPPHTCATKQVVIVPGGANTVPGMPEKMPHGLITTRMGIKLGLQPDTDVTFVGYQALPFAASTYQESSNDGYGRAVASINHIQNKCPNSTISFVGYSEGADISARIINDSAYGRGPLQKDRFNSAVLYSNPYQGRNGAAQWPTDMSEVTGALGHLDGGFGELASKVLEVCRPGDAICNYPEQYRGLVPPSMRINALHGQIPLLELAKEIVPYQPNDYINIVKGLVNHVQYSGSDIQAGVDWINNH